VREKLLGKFPSFFEKIQKIKCKTKGTRKIFGPMTSPAKMLDSADSFTELGDKSILFGASDSQLCGLKKRKVPTTSREAHAKVSYQNFDDEKNICKREEVEIDNEGQESSRSFFFLEIR
jgi:hypothetical protein